MLEVVAVLARGSRLSGLVCSALALAVVAVLAAGCDGGGAGDDPASPTPSETGDAAPAIPSPEPTGISVGIVLPPPALEPDLAEPAQQAAIEDLADGYDPDVSRIRVVTTDAPEFVGDAADLLADDGFALVCVLGPGAAEAVLAVADRYPTARFCAAPAQLEESPANVLAIDVRVEELAYTAGVATGVASPEAPPGFIAGARAYALDRVRTGYQQGLAAVRDEPVVPFVGFPATDVDTARELAENQFSAGVTAVYAVAGRAAEGVLEAAKVSGTIVVGPAAVLAPGTEADRAPPNVLAMTDIRYEVPVAAAIDRLLAGWDPGQISIGFNEDALRVSPGGANDTPAVFPRVEEAVEAIVAGQATVLP